MKSVNFQLEYKLRNSGDSSAYHQFVQDWMQPDEAVNTTVNFECNFGPPDPSHLRKDVSRHISIDWLRRWTFIQGTAIWCTRGHCLNICVSLRSGSVDALYIEQKTQDQSSENFGLFIPQNPGHAKSRPQNAGNRILVFFPIWFSSSFSGLSDIFCYPEEATSPFLAPTAFI